MSGYALALLGLLSLGCVGCAGVPGVAKKATAKLIISCQPGDAELYIDSRYSGRASAAKTGIRLPAGMHRVELRRTGFFSSFHEVKLVSGVTQKLVVALRREPF